MSIWDLLDIPATDDKKQIKKAYARQVAHFHPEEYPEQFKAIHAAYLSALTYADLTNHEHPTPTVEQPPNSPPSPPDSFQDGFQDQFQQFVDHLTPQAPTDPPPENNPPSDYQQELDQFRSTANQDPAQVPTPETVISDSFSPEILDQFREIDELSHFYDNYTSDLLLDLRKLPGFHKDMYLKYRNFARAQWVAFFRSERLALYIKHPHFLPIFTKYLTTAPCYTPNAARLLVRWLTPILPSLSSEIHPQLHALLAHLAELRRTHRPRKNYVGFIIFFFLMLTIFYPPVRDFDLRTLFHGGSSQQSYLSTASQDELRFVLDNLEQYYSSIYGDIFNYNPAPTSPYSNYHAYTLTLKDEVIAQIDTAKFPTYFSVYVPHSTEGSYLDHPELLAYIQRDGFLRAMLTSLATYHGDQLFTTHTHPVTQYLQIEPSLLYITIHAQEDYDKLQQALDALTHDIQTSLYLKNHPDDIYLIIDPPPMYDDYKNYLPDPPYLLEIPPTGELPFGELITFFQPNIVLSL